MTDKARELAVMLRRQQNKRKAAERVADKLLTLTPVQLKAARGLLDWSQSRLAAEAKVTDATIRAFEIGRSMLSDATLLRVHRVLEAAGVVLLKDGVARNGEGVMLRTQASGESDTAADIS